MNDGLTYEGLAAMNKADYIKAVKDKALWKKAEAILLLYKYKLNGTPMPVVALPLRKQKQMKDMLKTIKADKSKQKPNLKQVYIAQFELKKDEETGGTIARVHTPLLGKAMMAETFEKKGKALFDKLNYQLVVESMTEPQEELVEEQDQDSKEPTKTAPKLTEEQVAQVAKGTNAMRKNLQNIMDQLGIS